MKLMKNTLSTEGKLIAIGDRKATIEIAIGDLFWNCNRDRERDLKFDIKIEIEIAIAIFAIGVMPWKYHGQLSRVCFLEHQLTATHLALVPIGWFRFLIFAHCDFQRLKVSMVNKNKQLSCIIFARKQLFVIVFPWRLQHIKFTVCFDRVRKKVSLRARFI